MLFSMFVPSDSAQGDFWIEMDADDGGSMVGDLGAETGISDPRELLDSLGNTSASVVEVGADTVRGQAATKYRMDIDLEELAASLPPEEQAEFRDSMVAAPSELPVDFWIDGEGRLVKLMMLVENPDPQDEDLASFGFDIEFFDHGSVAPIVPPPCGSDPHRGRPRLRSIRRFLGSRILRSIQRGDRLNQFIDGGAIVGRPRPERCGQTARCVDEKIAAQLLCVVAGCFQRPALRYQTQVEQERSNVPDLSHRASAEAEATIDLPVGVGEERERHAK